MWERLDTLRVLQWFPFVPAFILACKAVAAFAKGVEAAPIEAEVALVVGTTHAMAAAMFVTLGLLLLALIRIRDLLTPTS